MHRIVPSPLTKSAFAAFGNVVETEGAMPVEINQGFATRFNHLADIDVASGGAGHRRRAAAREALEGVTSHVMLAFGGYSYFRPNCHVKRAP